MEPFEADLNAFINSVVTLCQKHEIRVADLNNLAQQADTVRGSFSFAKKLMDEVSSEGTSLLEKVRSLETSLEKEREEHESDISKLNETIKLENQEHSKMANHVEELEEKSNKYSESVSQLADELKTSKESVDMLKEELQKSYLTCTSYEQQILRLNEQLSIETMELQSKCDFYEKKVSELTEQLNTMEEEMYDPEAYYCLERDRVGDVGLCDYVVSQ